jgi:hypothetical protein
MSSSSPDKDTFENHFNELMKFFRHPENLSWTDILVVEAYSIIQGEVQLIPGSALIQFSRYKERFNELLGQGHSWINMNILGILDNTLIIQIEYPHYKNNVPGNKLSVHYSGPSIIEGIERWDLSSQVKIID